MASAGTANGQDGEGIPGSSRDLLPRKLYLAEILLLPFFWFGPLLLVVLGGLMAKDVRELKETYGVEFGDLRYLLYLAPFTIGHVGSLSYRSYRRRKLIQSHGIELSAANRLLREEYNSRNPVLVGWFIGQLLLFGLLVALPRSLPAVIDLIAGAVLLISVANLVVGPAVVWWDLRRILRAESVAWGRTRYLLVLTAAVPLGSAFYLAQRLEHLHYAMLCDIWTTDPDTLQLDDAEKTRREALADRVNERFPF